MSAQPFLSRVAAERPGRPAIHNRLESLGLLVKRFDDVKDSLCLDGFENHLTAQRLVALAAACQQVAEDLGWVTTTSITTEQRVERAAHYLYGLTWRVGLPAFTAIPTAAKRQWLEQARGFLEVLE